MSKIYLQSKSWEDFQQACGRKTFRVDEKLVIKYELPLGLSYLYCARPYFENEKEQKSFLTETKKIAQQENSIFLRIEPDLGSNLQLTALPAGRQVIGFRLVHNVQPQDTLILDLNKTEKVMLAEMHPKTRYNIRLAEKHEIKIKKSSNPKDIDIFYNLAVKTSERDRFRYHPRAYYKKMIETLGKNEMAELYIAYKDEAPTAAIIVIFFDDTAIYLHGASDHNYRNIMSPYLLQWEVIKTAKRRGFKNYDFWGIAPENAPENHTWKGVTRFKKGFAPNNPIIHYPNCYEIVYQKIPYQIYKIIQSIRKKR